MATALRSLSRPRPWQNAAKSPSAMPIPNDSNDAERARTRLFLSAADTSWRTGRRVAMDFPRSPWTTRPSQRRYWRGSGWSNPYVRLAASMSAWLASTGITAERGSPGARCTIAKTMMLAPSRVGIARSSRRPTYAHTVDLPPLPHHADRREVHEPGLRRHEALDLRRERPWVQVVDDEDPRRVVDDDLVQLRQDLALPADVERLRGLVEEPIHLGVDVRHRVQRDRHHRLRVEEAAEGRPRLLEIERDVPGVRALVLTLEAEPEALGQGVPLHRLQVYVDADFLQVLLHELVHGQRQHLPGPRRGDEVHGLRRLLAHPVEAGLTEELLRLRRVVLVRLLRIAEPRVALVGDARGRGARVVHEALADADAGDGVGRRHLDPVDLPAAERGQARGGLGHREEHGLVDLRLAPGIPVVLEGLQLEALARHELGQAERSRARRLVSELAPVARL